MRLSASRRPGAAPRSSQLVSQDIFQRLEVEGLVGDDPLQLAVLVLELLEPLRVRNLHAAVLPLPGIQGLPAHAEPAAQLAHVRACLRLLDRSDLLLLREPALAHDSSAFGAPESDYKWIRFGGQLMACVHAYWFSGSGWPRDQPTIARRVAAGIEARHSIRVHKRIPAGAGLVVDRAIPLQRSDSSIECMVMHSVLRACSMAASLGRDVPFFMSDAPLALGGDA